MDNCRIMQNVLDYIENNLKTEINMNELCDIFSKTPILIKSKWLEIFDTLVKGYECITPLSEYEKQALPYVIYSIQIICIAYFSQFDKFDSLTKINIDMLKWIFNKFQF